MVDHLPRDEFAVKPPMLVAAGPFDSRAVGSVTLAVHPPFLVAVSPLISRAIGSVELAIKIPLLVTVGVGLADWLSVHLFLAYYYS